MRLDPPAATPDRTPWNRFPAGAEPLLVGRNLALMGDAAHTTHFTVGRAPGWPWRTRLCWQRRPSVPAALAAHQATRQQHLRNVQRDAMRSARRFENVPRDPCRSDAEFAALMDDRRSRVMGLLPVGRYLRPARTANAVPMAAEPLRLVVSRF